MGAQPSPLHTEAAGAQQPLLQSTSARSGAAIFQRQYTAKQGVGKTAGAVGTSCCVQLRHKTTFAICSPFVKHCIPLWRNRVSGKKRKWRWS